MAVKEVNFERVYDAPIDTVWQAWTNPEQLKQWWGPQGVTIPECDVDLKVGGKFRIVMLAGETMGDFKGTCWPMEAEFTIVEVPNKLSYTAKAWTEGMEADTQIDSVQELTLSEESGKTVLRLRAAILQTGPQAGMAAEGMDMGYNQQLDKLAAFL